MMKICHVESHAQLIRLSHSVNNIVVFFTNFLSMICGAALAADITRQRDVISLRVVGMRLSFNFVNV